MKNNTLILMTILYLTLSVIFNYGLFRLLTIDEFKNQYFLIFIYFLSEIISFIFFLFPKSKDKIISNALGPIIINEGSFDISLISAIDNNLSNNITTSLNNTDNNLINNATTSLNATETRMSSLQQQPFVGMKIISFVIPSTFDFFSKFCIFNGIKIIGNEIVFRSLIQLLMVLCLSFFLLKSKYINFSIKGVYVILGGLFFSFLYSHFTKKIKLYFEFDSHGILGAILCFVGEVFASFQILFQKKYLNIGEKHCHREIAWEGLFGFIISFIFFELSLFIHCPDEDNDKIKNTFFYCYDSSKTPFNFLLINFKNNLAWNILFFLVSISYNLIGVIITKYIGEVYRVAVDVGRISIIVNLILFIHTSDIEILSAITSGVIMITLLVGIILCIFLRKQKDITFEPLPLEKANNQDLSLVVEENHCNVNESDIIQI